MREFGSLANILAVKKRKDIEGEIEWYETLLESLEKGETEWAIQSLRRVVELKKREIGVGV